MVGVALCWWAVLMAVASTVILGIASVTPGSSEEKHNLLQLSNLLFVLSLALFASAWAVIW